MSQTLDVEMKFISKSDRVKCVDFHKDKPWVMCALHDGYVRIINYEDEKIIYDIKVSNLPVRSAKFLNEDTPWIITASDDRYIRFYEYATAKLYMQYKAHSDYVRCIVVVPAKFKTPQYYNTALNEILTGGDDMLIKLWSSSTCQREYKGHMSYVMQIVWNPKDDKTFASASLDGTIKVWHLDSDVPNFTLEGHQNGVHCVEYYHGKDQPYLISGGVDGTVKIWDYAQKTCVQNLVGHPVGSELSAIYFHPEFQVFLTGSIDGTVCIWHSSTYALITSLNYNFKRLWSISCQRDTRYAALGYDTGLIMIKVGPKKLAFD